MKLKTVLDAETTHFPVQKPLQTSEVASTHQVYSSSAEGIAGALFHEMQLRRSSFVMVLSRHDDCCTWSMYNAEDTVMV